MDLEAELLIAINAAVQVGEFILQEKNKSMISDYGKDIKLEADKISEEKILGHLSKSKYNILSEETPDKIIKNKDSDLCWIIDPLDGSFNLYKGIPHTAVSISLWKGMQPLLGVIYDIYHKDLYSGIVGQGIKLNNQKISVNDIEEKNKAVLMTGFPTKLDYSEENLKGFIRKIQDFKKIRHIGSAALSLAYIASGKAEAYYEKDIMLWDIAAGLALVKAAGGTVDLKQTKGYQFEVFASNKKLI